MNVKVLQLCFIFLLGFLFSSGTFVYMDTGTFAKDLEEQTHRLLSSHPAAFHLQISKFDELLTEKPSPHRLLIVPAVTGPDTTPAQLDHVTTSMTTTVPTINPSTTTPTTTTPTYSNPTPTYTDPTPTYSNPTPMGTPVTTPTTSTPTGNPVTTPYTTPTPTMGTPPSTSSGQSWCIASQSASQTALKVALDYACGYGGADCTAVQQGGSCFNPDTLRDHASYAFNSYYQKNPVPTSCDFGGAAMITNTDPSTSTCQYPSSASTSSSPTNPTGSSPPDYGGGTISVSTSMSSSFSLMILLLSLICFKVL